MSRLVRILKYANYPFLGLSALLFAGMVFGAAFVARFSVENRTGEPIVVTPVGTAGTAGSRAPLPVLSLGFPSLPALRSGGFRLAPGESVSILYDMDDIRLSELVVAARPGQALPMVAGTTPAAGQDHGPDPRGRRYVIDDLTRLGPATSSVRRAALAADRQWVVACISLTILLGPWLLHAILARLTSRVEAPGAEGLGRATAA